MVVWLAWRTLPVVTAATDDPAGLIVASLGLVVALPGLAFAFYSARASILAVRYSEPEPGRIADRVAKDVLEREREALRQLLGNHYEAIDVGFSLHRAPAHPAAGAGERSRLTSVVNYFQKLRPRRMVITGEPGAGKTVLAVKLIMGLLQIRSSGDPVPIRIAAASLDSDLPLKSAVEEWLRRHLTEVYRLRKIEAGALVSARLVLPVIDGLDELDTEIDTGSRVDPDAGRRVDHAGGTAVDGARAARVLVALNAYQDHDRLAAVVLTCRSDRYEALEQQRIWAHHTARVELAPLRRSQILGFLQARSEHPARWKPVSAALSGRRAGTLAQALSTPWRLAMAAFVYEQREPSNIGSFVRDPADLIAIAAGTPAGLDPLDPERGQNGVEIETTLNRSSNSVGDHLMGLLIPAAVAVSPPPGRADAESVQRWLATLARYLHHNTAHQRTLGGRSVSGTDLVWHRLWPMAGLHRPRLVASLLGYLACLPVLVFHAAAPLPLERQYLPGWDVYVVALTILIGVPWLAWIHPWAQPWSRLSMNDVKDITASRGRRDLRTAVMWGFGAGSCYALIVGSARGIAAGLLTGLGFGVGSAFVALAVTRLRSGPENPPRAGADGPSDGIIRSELASAAGGVLAVVTAFAAVGATQAIQPLGSIDDLALNITGWALWGLLTIPVFGHVVLRYVALLLCTRRGPSALPWRLGKFLRWAYDAGLLRVAGDAYQFRHLELQDYLARRPSPDRTPRRHQNEPASTDLDT
ncbi:NACHT domain-containing protein [Streptosporangium sp. H16]|uniref:NACHT domain-containing protein n=1 Tax=Streptosporangium sp. H16 TaxID=3444184 RepID=UPI003F78EB38